MKIFMILLGSLFSTFAFAVPAGTDTLTVSGRLLDPSNTPVTAASVNFKVYIYDPTANNCLLYSEDVANLDMTSSNGNFEIKVGTGTVLSGSSLRQSLDNRAAFTGLTSCDAGNSYTPSAADGRRVKIIFNDGFGAHSLSSIELTSVPWAMHANSVGGFNADSLLRIENAGLVGTASPLTSANVTELMALILGTSTQYSKTNQLNGSSLPNMSPGSSLSWNGSTWSAITPLTAETDPSVAAFAKANSPVCSAGQVLTWDGTSVSCVTPSAPAGITSLNGQVSGTQNFAIGTSGNSPAFNSISSTHTLNIPLASTFGVTAGLLSYNDYSSLIKASSMPANCFAGSTLTFSSPTGTWLCTTIAIDANAVTSGTVADARLPASATFWQTATGGIQYSGGNVGIGTTAPASTLEISATDSNTQLKVVNTDSTSSRRPSVLVSNFYGSTSGGVSFPRFMLTNSGGNAAASTALQAGEILGEIQAFGKYDGSPSTLQGAGISFRSEGNFAASTAPTSINFLTGSTGTMVNRMTILSDGRIGIATTAPGYPLDVAGQINSSSKYSIGGVTAVSVDSNYNTLLGKTNNTALTGSSNTLIGYSAGYSLSSGSDNILIGKSAGLNLSTSATSNRNIFIGNSAGLNANNSGNNMAIGYAAGSGLTTGTRNVFLGNMAGANATTGSDNILIGYGADVAIPSDNNILRIGSWIFGNGSNNVGIGVANPAYRLDVGGEVNLTTNLRINGTAICTSAGCVSSSDRRLKENIKPLENSLEKLLRLRGVSYSWIDKEKFGYSPQVGLIAQEVEEVFPEVVVTDDRTDQKSISYSNLVAPIVEAIRSLFHSQQDQSRRLAAVEEENLRLKAYLCSKDPQAPFCQ